MRLQRSLPFFILLLGLAVLWAGCSAPAPFAAPAGEMPAAPASAPSFAEPVTEDATAFAVAGTGINIPDTRKVIANANIELVVADTEAAVEEIKSLARDVGGFIANANLYRSNYGDSNLLSGSLTLRVPAERLEETLDRLSALAVEVRSENIDRQDVTDQYSDIEAQLRNLQATENELRELLAEVRARPNATPDDILAVYRSLTEIRGQIEQLQGRKNLLDNQIALSTITVNLIPDAASRPIVEEGWRPAVVSRNALRALVNTLEFLGTVAIWFGIYILPLAVLALIVLSIAIVVLRGVFRFFRKRSKTKAALPVAGED